MRAKLLILVGVLSLSSRIYGMDVMGVNSVNTDVPVQNQHVVSDLNYMNELAYKYSKKVVVKKTTEYSIEPIQKMIAGLIDEVTVDEIDNAEVIFNVPDTVGDVNYRKNLLNVRNIAHFTGIGMRFEPLVAYDMYRDVQLVAGYMSYSGSGVATSTLLNNYVDGIQDTTKEIVGNKAKSVILNKINHTVDFIQNDKSLKVFIIKGDMIDSMYEIDNTLDTRSVSVEKPSTLLKYEDSKYRYAGDLNVTGQNYKVRIRMSAKIDISTVKDRVFIANENGIVDCKISVVKDTVVIDGNKDAITDSTYLYINDGIADIRGSQLERVLRYKLNVGEVVEE